MENEKLDPQLILSLQREKSRSLEVLIRYWGSREGLYEIVKKYNGSCEILLAQYAIVRLEQENVNAFAMEPEILYVEKPKPLKQEAGNAIQASCPGKRQASASGGKGVLMGIIDSGMDILHPDFIRADGRSAVVGIWDQTKELESAPFALKGSTFFDQQQINEAVKEKRNLISDLSGHGTHIASIAAGNQGVAPESEILFVKLGGAMRTTQLIRGVDVLIRTAMEKKQPMAINISYGTNEGGHNGRSLLESYLNDVALLWPLMICAGTGNEGDTGKHKGGRMGSYEECIIEISMAEGESELTLELWKYLPDEMEMFLRLPSGAETRIEEQQMPSVISLDQMQIHYLYGKTTPYDQKQEILMAFTAQEQWLEAGIWTLIIRSQEVKYGRYDLWLPISENNSKKTKFVQPTPEYSLTIPSTVERIVSVGAYDSRLQTYASFSGRGDGSIGIHKPDLAAPGVDIMAAAPGGGWTKKSGTSMAVPFVTGAAALMMEWGIVKGNDPFLYGEKGKSYLQKGARRLRGIQTYPNDQIGWGTLCIDESFG